MEAVFDDAYHPDFNLYRLCQKFRCLPYVGGIANQPAQLVEKWIMINNTLLKQRELEEGTS